MAIHTQIQVTVGPSLAHALLDYCPLCERVEKRGSPPSDSNRRTHATCLLPVSECQIDGGEPSWFRSRGAKVIASLPSPPPERSKTSRRSTFRIYVLTMQTASFSMTEKLCRDRQELIKKDRYGGTDHGEWWGPRRSLFHRPHLPPRARPRVRPSSVPPVTVASSGAACAHSRPPSHSRTAAWRRMGGKRE